MEELQEFVAEIPETLDTKALEEKELEQDYHAYFSPHESQLFEFKRSGQSLNRNSIGDLDRAISRWWFEKYGFSHSNKVSRQALLARKYEKPENNRSAQIMQNELFDAIRKNDNAAYVKVYQRYIEEFPNQLEGVTALLEFPDHLTRHTFLNEHSFRDEDPGVRDEMLKTVEESTQYAFLLTHFLVHNGNDKEFLNNFWDVVEHMADGRNMIKETHQLRRGILSQVAVLHVFNRLGMDPKLSHPQEDAFKSVDMWVEGAGAVQVKGTDKRKDEMFIETDEIDFPGIQTQDGDGVRHVNSHLFKEFNKFKAKLSKYQEELQKPLRGYFAVMPYHEFDHVTGMPSEEIIARSAESLGITYQPDK